MRRFVLSLMCLAVSSAYAADLDAPFYEDKQDLLYYLDAEGNRQEIEEANVWPARRVHVLRNLQKVTGKLPDPSKRVDPAVEVLETEEFETYTRKKITFAVEAGDRLPAYLFLPKGVEGKSPAMLCLHPTSKHGKGQVSGLGDKPNRDYAVELAERGYVTLAPDYPGFGDYEIDVYAMGYESATAKAIWNQKRCTDLLQSMEEVDPRRMGSIGHSLGGHSAIYHSVFDDRIRVTVSSCGFNSFAKYYGGNLNGWSHKGYMPRIASEYGKDPAQMPFDFTELIGALAPRAAFVSAPLKDANFEVSGVRDCIAAAQPVYALFGAEEQLQAIFPDSGHDFPPAAREEAYSFIDEILEHTPRTHIAE